MGDQRKLAENEGAPRVRMKSALPPPGDLERRHLQRRVEKLERRVRVLERDAAARRMQKEFEAKPGDV